MSLVLIMCPVQFVRLLMLFSQLCEPQFEFRLGVFHSSSLISLCTGYYPNEVSSMPVLCVVSMLTELPSPCHT